ncbi:GNAT family N-acetyltransferase [Kosakonia sp. BK9b]
MNIKHKLMGWSPCDFERYAAAYYQFGGSVNMHPDLVQFFLKKGCMKFTFWHYCQRGETTAAYFTADGKHVGLNVWRDYPISYDEVMMPVAAEQKIWFPERTNRLSAANRRNIINAAFIYRNKRQICRIKDHFSVKTTRKRNSELKKFLAAGGTCYPLAELSSAEIARLYVYLFKRRFADTVRCYDRMKITELLSAVRHMIFGNVLFFDGMPCAIDLVLAAPSQRMIYFDVPNGGLDPQFAQHSPGSLLMWANITDARKLCHAQNKHMAFAIGLYDKNWEYKLRWSEPTRTGKIIC